MIPDGIDPDDLHEVGDVDWSTVHEQVKAWVEAYEDDGES